MCHEFMPEWAIGVSDGIQVGSQLCTRDGRRIGNARVVGSEVELAGSMFSIKAWPVRTDFGNELFLTTSEIEEFFYPPKWLMSVGMPEKAESNA